MLTEISVCISNAACVFSEERGAGVGLSRRLQNKLPEFRSPRNCHAFCRRLNGRIFEIDRGVRASPQQDATRQASFEQLTQSLSAICPQAKVEVNCADLFCI